MHFIFYYISAKNLNYEFNIALKHSILYAQDNLTGQISHYMWRNNTSRRQEQYLIPGSKGKSCSTFLWTSHITSQYALEFDMVCFGTI
jgi:hypothetical protein